MMKAAGLPDMLVLPATKLMELGRIPRSNEGHAITARAAVEQCGKTRYPGMGDAFDATIFFFSHKWKRPNWCAIAEKDLLWGTEERIAALDAGHHVGDPDGAGHEKALALIEWTKWVLCGISQQECFISTKCIQPEKRMSLEKMFFWIDWPCVDQENAGPYMASLPAYVATCDSLVAAWSDACEKSAWCRVERMIAYSFMQRGKQIYTFQEGFVMNEFVQVHKKTCFVPDPSKGIVQIKKIWT